MKRRWVWIAGCTLFVTAALVGLMLALPPAAPFGFLRGQRQVELELPPEARADHAAHRLVVTTYSFKDDFARVKREAAKELLAAGYKDMSSTLATGPNQAGYVKDGILPPTTGTEPPDFSAVMILGNTSIPNNFRASPKNDPTGKAKGWVTVVISARALPKKGLFERFREWIGL